MVAFVFIPLSFTSSFFGMNIRELETGSLSIGYFFLLAILSGALCVVLGLYLGRIEGFLSSIGKRFTRKRAGLKTRLPGLNAIPGARS